MLFSREDMVFKDETKRAGLGVRGTWECCRECGKPQWLPALCIVIIRILRGRILVRLPEMILAATHIVG